jgi:hypothetical protein
MAELHRQPGLGPVQRHRRLAGFGAAHLGGVRAPASTSAIAATNDQPLIGRNLKLLTYL